MLSFSLWSLCFDLSLFSFSLSCFWSLVVLVSVSAILFTFFVAPFYSVIRHASGKIEALPLGGFFYVECPRQSYQSSFAIVLFYCLFGNFVSSYDASLWLYLKIRGKDNSPTHHFLREMVEPKQETQDRALCPVPLVLALPPTTFPCVGFLLPWSSRKKERGRASLMASLITALAFYYLEVIPSFPGCVLGLCSLCIHWHVCMCMCAYVFVWAQPNLK